VDACLVADQDAEQPAVDAVPKSGRSIVANCHDHLPIRTEGGASDRSIMTRELQPGQLTTVAGVPAPCGTVVRGRKDAPAVALTHSSGVVARVADPVVVLGDSPLVVVVREARNATHTHHTHFILYAL
jgi:hypothetical protein